MSLPRLLVYLLAQTATLQALTIEELAQFKTNRSIIEKNTKQGGYVNVSTVDDYIEVTFNSVPQHYTGWFDGNNTRNNKMKAKTLSIRVNTEPQRASNTLQCLPFGIIGVTTAGVAINNPYAMEEGCPWAERTEELDACKGHPDENGRYHYHSYSMCHQMLQCGVESPLYGVAIDGYPIYGPIDEFGNQLTLADLDPCGGKVNSAGNYRYHATLDQPSILNCLRGELRRDLGINPDLFVCACPYDDSHFGPKRDIEKECGLVTSNSTARCQPEPDVERTMYDGKNITQPSVCNFTGLYGPAKCYVNRSLWQYNITWNREQLKTDLIPCCPEGDCGGTCWDTAGKVKSECRIEDKMIQVMTLIRHKNGGCAVQIHVVWVMVYITALLMGY